ncbi:hypothetical protein [Tuwongella immobilis]|uniref:Uncharacterized protein n=1 Tax=Tuwongella immobilis TaxID=692036 RepID=A0A6C2YIT0_9BACT|nr:hypothetical protein [Tuwongella immobilis]VIP01043.1 Uncharacterized protein OS=Singulisphaera acidiphila (strain ATCC BAA-1392 / DSM 18658 / VKM B-2454 / MOB10) GN=Sinac_3508 PE=4 SV=1 [Tuwongella immobilis]VTR97511.1 Uncharacterized protein OS=Singulisphaera acidiphila (strain ATCC BAA-1392 / DSM 18658 / VKM B-2454 / MOB10) GN=Sinac_3508 PE=4 SV=1 [Tuwongella immobilis]
MDRILIQAVTVSVALLVGFLGRSLLLRHLAVCLLAFIAYGMLQDQISVRFCPDYFTRAHAPIPGVDHPTLLALLWGFLGGWPGGLAAGIAVGLSATIGKRPPRTIRQLRNPLILLLLGMAVNTLLVGCITARTVDVLGLELGEPWRLGLPAEQRQAMIILTAAHLTTYSTAVLGTVLICGWTIWQRRQADPSAPSLES